MPPRAPLRCCILQARRWHHALAALPALATLDLRGCDLPRLPSAVVKLASLTALLLSGNRVVTLPEGPYLRHLARLDLGRARQAGQGRDTQMLQRGCAPAAACCDRLAQFVHSQLHRRMQALTWPLCKHPPAA